MGCCDDCLTCDIAFNAVMPLSRASTRRRYSRIEGVTSWLSEPSPTLGAPCLIESLALLSLEQKCFESLDYIYRRVGFFLLLSPFVALVRSPDVEVLTLLSSNFTNFFLGSRGYLGIVPMVLWREHCLGASCQGFCGSVPGSWAPRCCRHNFIVAVLEYLSLVRRHRKSLLCSSLVR